MASDEDSSGQQQEPPSLVDKLKVIPGIGLLLALFSGVCIATAQFTVAFMSEVDPSFLMVSRCVVQAVVVLPVVYYQKHSMLGAEGEMKPVMERAVCGFFTFMCTYHALRHISLADANSIIFTAPVLTSLFACVLLKEPCGIFHVASILVTLVGAFLISRPTFLFPSTVDDGFSIEQRIIGICLSVGTSLSMSYGLISMRRLKKTSASAVILVFSLFSICAGSITMNVFSFITNDVPKLPASELEWLLCLVNGLCGVIGQASLVLSLKLEEAALVSLMRTSDIVMAFLYQAAFLPQPLFLTSIIGAGIICSACIAVGLKKYFDYK